MQMEPSRSFTFLGPRVRIVERMVQDIPLPRHRPLERKPPEIEQFRADPEGIRRYRGLTIHSAVRRIFQLAFIPCLGKAHRRLVDPNHGDIREALRQMERTFAGTATGIQDERKRPASTPRLRRKTSDKFTSTFKRSSSMVRHRTQKSRGRVLAHHGFKILVNISLVTCYRMDNHYFSQMERRLPPISSISSSQNEMVFSSLFGLKFHVSWFTHL